MEQAHPDRVILAFGGGFGEFPNDKYFIHKGWLLPIDRSNPIIPR